MVVAIILDGLKKSDPELYEKVKKHFPELVKHPEQSTPKDVDRLDAFINDNS